MINRVREEMMRIEGEIKNCKKCSLYKSRNKPVPGEGSLEPKIFFIGEAPGAQEDATGRPFVGAAGRLLTTLIEEIGLKRDDVYITNVVKCRPPHNRDPSREEIEACKPYLIRQLELMKPSLIVTLGRHAANVISEFMNKKFRSMTKEHGKRYDTTILGFKSVVIHTYHPAAALYNPSLLDSLREDFKIIKDVLKKKRERKTLDDFL